MTWPCVHEITAQPRSNKSSIVSQISESLPRHLFCPPDLLKIFIFGNQGNFRFTGTPPLISTAYLEVGRGQTGRPRKQPRPDTGLHNDLIH